MPRLARTLIGVAARGVDAGEDDALAVGRPVGVVGAPPADGDLAGHHAGRAVEHDQIRGARLLVVGEEADEALARRVPRLELAQLRERVARQRLGVGDVEQQHLAAVLAARRRDDLGAVAAQRVAPDAGAAGELRADEALGGGGGGVAEVPAHDPGAARGRPVVQAAAHVVLRELHGERRALADGGAVVVGPAHGQLQRAGAAVGLGDVAPDLAARARTGSRRPAARSACRS